MYYADIRPIDVANGPGIRVSLFVSGCTHRCRDCFNEKAWDFHYGHPFGQEQTEEIIRDLSKPYIKGLSLLGGEPFEPENQRALLPFLRRLRQELPEKNVWAFTGFTWEELHTEGSHPRCEVTDELLSLIDVLVDGRYVEELKDIGLRFRGSSNQRLLDLNATRASGILTRLPDHDRCGRKGE